MFGKCEKSICCAQILKNENFKKGISEALKEQGFICHALSFEFKPRTRRLVLDMSVKEKVNE